MTSYYEASARERILGLLDPGTFREFMPPQDRVVSPHLIVLDTPAAFDDGVIVGRGRARRPAGADRRTGGRFHGRRGGGSAWRQAGRAARTRARKTPDAAVLLLVESGGVRLHEANAGLIGVSEIMRAILVFARRGRAGARARRRPVRLLWRHGHRLAPVRRHHHERRGQARPVWPRSDRDHLRRGGIRLPRPRAGLAHGRRQASLLLGEANALVADDIGAFRTTALAFLDAKPDLSLEALKQGARLSWRQDRPFRRLPRCARHLAASSAWKSRKTCLCLKRKNFAPPSPTRGFDNGRPHLSSTSSFPLAIKSHSTASISMASDKRRKAKWR